YNTKQGRYPLKDRSVADFNLDVVGGSPPPSSNKVTISVKVTDKQAKLLGGVPVLFWRKDGVSKTVKTGSNPDDKDTFGIAKLEVDRYDGNCGSGSKCYNIMANKWDVENYPQVSGYFNSTEKVNVEPDGPGTEWVTLVLPTSTVTLTGYVYVDNRPIKGIIVFLWNHDKKTKWAAETDDKGFWSQVVPRWVWDGTNGREDRRFQIVANKDGSGYRYNADYTTSEEIDNFMPADDTRIKTLNLHNNFVSLGGTVFDKDRNKLDGVWVYFWRQDKKHSFYVQTANGGRFSAKVEKSSETTMRYNIAANKDNADPDHPKVEQHATYETNDVSSGSDRTTMEFKLPYGYVTFKGQVTDTLGKGVPSIVVAGNRQDGRASFTVTTDSVGKWSTPVEKFTEANHRFTVVANPRDTKYNSKYANSTPHKNIQPSTDQSIYPKLVTSKVTFSGIVRDSRGILADIPVRVSKTDGRAASDGRTGSDGKFNIQVDGSTNTADKYTVTANADGTVYPRNTRYNTPAASGARSADRDQNVGTFTLTAVTQPVPTTTVPPIPNPVPPTPPPTPDDIRFTVVAAEMVSPDELGIAVKVTYPGWINRDAQRTITIDATINNKPVSKTFTVTDITWPGVQWDDTTMSGTFRVKPTTPIRINLREAGVDRFKDDVTFTVNGKASYGGGLPSRVSSVSTTIPLPVIFYHGYLNWWQRDLTEINDGAIHTIAYEPFSAFLLQKGYNREFEWGIVERAQLALNGYPIRRYVTLLDMNSGVTYTTAEAATPSVLLNDVQTTIDRIRSASYAERVNLVGHSTGGLNSFYYASVRPQYVARVITVGTPMEGLTRVYDDALGKGILGFIFGQTTKSRQDAEAMLTVQDGPNKGQENTLRWFLPKFTALEIPGYVAGRDPDPYFTSTFTYQPNKDVEYHHVYSSSHDTTKMLVLEKNTDGRWYHVKEEKYGAGDGTVLATSGSNPKMSGTNIHRYQVSITERHAKMLRESSVHNAIWTALKHKRSTIRSQSVVDAAGVNPSVTIGTPGFSPPSVIDVTG
ncbi:MAG: alpha/beta hydrolase, partial [Methanomicrobiales archaeon]|nr:alpha/beta hydrolase [Methanomicrobiales archaeon]